MRISRPDAGYALVTVGASSLLAAFVLRLWNASLGIPFAPGGDGYLVLMQVKGLLDNGWVLTNAHLGAPLGQDMYDYAANRELLHVLAIKALGLFSSNPAAIVNVYFLLSFPLVGLVAFVVMRWLGISRPVAALMAVLFALAPFHFRHQTFLYAYYTVPLSAYLILAVYSEAPLFEGRSRRTALTAAICVVVALASFYFAAFTVILVAVAAALTALASRRIRPLVQGGVVVAIVVATGLVASTPDLIYRANHGRNPVVAKRGPEESESYATNFLQLVMPVQEHRVAPLRHLRQRWIDTTPVDGEATNLGLVAALGFVWLLLVVVVTCIAAGGRFVAERRQRHLAVSTATALLLGTTGGLSAFIAYVVSPQLRSWTRLSIFIAFFSLAAVGLLLDAAYAKWGQRRLRGSRALVAGVLVGICAIAVYDQTTKAFVPSYDANAATWHADERFAQRIQSTLPAGAMVFQLPYIHFPESEPVLGTGPYDGVRPYLHTTRLRWSFGAMRARPKDWQAELAAAPPASFVPAVAAAGFSGIYVDRAAYPDGGRALEGEVGRLAGAAPIVSPDNRFAFYDLRRYASALRARTSPGELRAVSDATLFPVRADWKDPFFSKPQPEAVGTSRWAVSADARLSLTNPSDAPREATVFARLARTGGAPAAVDVSYPDGSSETVQVPSRGTEIRRSVRLPPGGSAIALATSGPPIAVSGDVPAGFVQVREWWIGPGA